MTNERSDPTLASASSERRRRAGPGRRRHGLQLSRAPGLKLEPGAFVRMPLGARIATGVVWAARAAGGDNLKSIAEVLDWPPLRPALRDFIDWTARWTLAPRGMLLAHGDPRRRNRRAAGAEVRPCRHRQGADAHDGSAGARPRGARGERARRRPKPRSPRAPRARPASSTASSPTARSRRSRSRRRAARRRSTRISARPRLNADQRAAADDLIRLVADRAFSATLLEGVTGSGKTEVYFEAVAEALRQKRQALVLLPEIALTAQFLDRFAARFGARPAEWHSGLTERQRERVWTAAASGEARVDRRRALGALSAVRRPRPHRRRRGARGRLQAGGGRHLQRARHGGGARAAREGADRARLRDAGDRDPLQRRRAAATAGSGFPRASARRGCPTSPWSTSSAKARRAAGGSRRARSPRSRRRGAGASRRCCSSTGAAMRRSPSAAPAAIASNAPIARPGWSSTVSAPPSSAIIAAMSRAGRSFARNATRPTRSPPAGRASSAWPRRRSPLSRHPHARAVIRYAGRDRDPARPARRRGARRLRPHHRHAARRQGAQFPAAHLRLRRRRRRRPRQRRSARGRAHVPAAAPGDRARRARATSRDARLLQTWQPEHPVIAALMSGDAERFYREETEQRRLGGLPPFGRLAAIIVSAEDRGAAEAHARALARAAHRLPGAKNWRVAPLGGQPRRERDRPARPGRGADRGRCANAIASASPPRRRARPTCRVSCAPCWPPRPSRAAGFALRSTSIRRAFFRVRPRRSPRDWRKRRDWRRMRR